MYTNFASKIGLFSLAVRLRALQCHLVRPTPNLKSCTLNHKPYTPTLKHQPSILNPELYALNPEP